MKVNPIHLKGTELTVQANGSVEQRDIEFDADIFDDLKVDGFEAASPLEFNLYQKGLA